MIPVAIIIELGIKLISAGATAIKNRRESVSDEDLLAIQAEIKRHEDRWGKLFSS